MQTHKSTTNALVNIWVTYVTSLVTYGNP